MPSESPFASIPDAPTLEKRFSFVESEVTRQNLTFCFQYIIFLSVVKSLYKYGGPIELSINRDIVVHTASVIESCLYYGIKQMIKLGLTDESRLPKKWKQQSQGHIHVISEDENIVWIKQKRIASIFGEKTMSKAINDAARTVGLIDDELYKKAEAIRNARNNIHFIKDEKMVEYPDDKDVESYFEYSSDLLKAVEDKLQT